MQLKYFLAASAASLTLATVIATPAFAQETSAAVRGTVVGDKGGPVAGAKVSIVHEPSGTTAEATTSADGTFSINGLRVGGPFTVTIDAAGYEMATVNDVNLSAGITTRLPISLKTEQQIVVTGASLAPAVTLTDGPTTALGRAQIEASASINRDIRDLARRDPLVTIDLTNGRTIEIAGNNGRLNRFSVDGMQMSDDFGINNGGLPTNRGPVPYDAIEQFTVKVAPFDIAEGDMQGGAINVVLRSGTNKFHGGGFFSYTGDGLTSSRSRSTNVALDFSSKQWGGWLAGPIVKDKLFFMLAYERTKEGQPLDAGFGSGFATQIGGITQANVDLVTSVAKSRYGYDTMGLIATTTEGDEKIVGKLDWNISDTQRASLTYIRNVGTNQFQQNTFTTQPLALGFASDSYQLREEVNSGTFELNSSWTDSLSTNFRVSYRDYNRGQTPIGATPFPQVGVCLDATSTPLSASTGQTSCTGTRLFFGPDISRQANKLNTENLSVDFTVKLALGSHDYRLMVGYTKVNVYNLFVQSATGSLYFDSLADFQTGTANQLVYNTAVPSADPNDAAARFNTTNWTFGIQDEWQVSDKFKLTVGTRYDLFDNNVAPPLNPNYLSRYGYSNRSTFKGRGVIQSRVAFDWEPSDRLVVRGGVGIFAGGTPDVFLSNVYSNTGLLTNQVTFTRNTSAAGCNVPTTGAGAVTLAQAQAICAAALNNINSGTIQPGVVNYVTTNTGTLQNSPTDTINPNLKLASKMKATLQVDYKADLGPLGDGWLFGVQALYDKTIDGYMWVDQRSTQVGTLPDGRPRYTTITPTSTTNRDLQLVNTTDGRAWFLTARFAKDWTNGLSISGSYTRSNVKDRSALTSSTSSSNYGNNAFLDPNLPAYGRSIYEYTNQWKFSIDYRHAFFGDAKTTIGIFGEIRSGRPYSLTMLDNSGSRGAVFGTVGNLGNMLLYVPNLNDPKVSFDTVASETAFNALVDQLGLGKYRGSILSKNTQTSPSFFKLDLHFGQEIPLPGFLGGRPKIELFADIENVLNLINRDWGSLRQVAFPYNAAIVRVACLGTGTLPPTGSAPGSAIPGGGTYATTNTASTQACQAYRYSNVLAPNEVLQTRQSLYGIRVGVKVKF